MHPVLSFAIGAGFTLTFIAVWYLAKRDVDREAGVCRGYQKPPTALGKSMEDQFDYAMKLRTGEVLRFERAEDLGGGWVRVHFHEDGNEFHIDYFPAPRGVDVRVSEIIWVIDAPIGS